jgi:hypothetical protein
MTAVSSADNVAPEARGGRLQQQPACAPPPGLRRGAPPHRPTTPAPAPTALSCTFGCMVTCAAGKGAYRSASAAAAAARTGARAAVAGGVGCRRAGSEAIAQLSAGRSSPAPIWRGAGCATGAEVRGQPPAPPSGRRQSTRAGTSWIACCAGWGGDGLRQRARGLQAASRAQSTWLSLHPGHNHPVTMSMRPSSPPLPPHLW